jgi:hypothetical protein
MALQVCCIAPSNFEALNRRIFVVPANAQAPHLRIEQVSTEAPKPKAKSTFTPAACRTRIDDDYAHCKQLLQCLARKLSVPCPALPFPLPSVPVTVTVPVAMW